MFYPEFKLQNILVLNGKITFIDYGLARCCDVDNSENCARFVKLLTVLNDRFSTVRDRDERYMLYSVMNC